MSFSKVYSSQARLLQANVIDIEVDISKGLHAFALVGLPDKAVEEARDRVSAAIKNTGFRSPKSKNQKVIISLAPANIKKEGASFDLGVAVAYLLATGDVQFDPHGKMFLGELSLDGKLRKIRGVLPLVLMAKERGFKQVYLPKENANEAAVIDDIAIYGAESLKEVIDHINEIDPTPKQMETIPYYKHGRPDKKLPVWTKTSINRESLVQEIDFSDIRSQLDAKRGLEIAAAGGHNIALYGPPGTGKTLLARAFPGILPPLSFEDTLEATSIHSIAGILENDLVLHPPFRAPHHTSSYVSLVGGGSTLKPGEITLAHRGVLFLDEFPEFDRRVIEALRQPLEDRKISISRSKESAIFPANFILIAAMNPCPCGKYGTGSACHCPQSQIDKYKRKISGPIVDRIDMWIRVPKIDHVTLSEKNKAREGSAEIRKRVENARVTQQKRFFEKNINLNSEMNVKHLDEFPLKKEVSDLLNLSAAKLDLSPRSYHRVIKLSRTIADLDGSLDIKEEHLLEALQYRPGIEA
jgi:magnesium chelatase family protein